MSKNALIKETIERLLLDGYAPYKVYKGLNGKGSAIQAAAVELQASGILHPTNRTYLADWVLNQIKRKAEGRPDHFCPNWDLYPVNAAKLGKLGYKPVLPGFAVTETNTRTDKDGMLVGQSIKTKAQPQEEFVMPQGHSVKGISAFVNAEGKVIGQWVKTRNDDRGPDALAALFDAFAEYKGTALLVPAPAVVAEDLLTAYYIGDHHLGMFSWRDETGTDYDVRIGEKLLADTMADLLSQTPASKQALVISLGDFFHTDSSSNQTPGSKHSLDVDTRRAKVYKIGVKLMISCIEMALQKHEHVKVRCLPGNHDPETTPTLAIALWAFFHNNPRVEIDCDASRYFFYEFGRTMIAGTHGDMCKIQDMPGVMAALKPDMWGRTRFRYAVSGHIHHKSMFCKEILGAICETFQVLPPPDSWHAGMGFGAGRSMTAVTYSKTGGEKVRHIASVSREDIPLEPVQAVA